MRRDTSLLQHCLSRPRGLLVALTTSAALTIGLMAPTASADGSVSPSEPAGSSEPTLGRAARALNGASQGSEKVAATLALRDLFLARPSLDESDERAADRLLARPTDGVSDPYGDGYVSSATKACAAHVCVHWVRSGADAPPDGAWAKKTLAVMEQVWKHHIGRLGYRKPAKDGSRGGNAKFDVYLKEIGAQGLYGYCAPEQRVSGKPKQASGFCVLDDDFARSQFGRAPIQSLRVTAAHEFFHAVQFAYDYTEDPWLLESTATWMEERFADDVNDNRAYLKYGQAWRSSTSLDLFDANGLAHYGNWVWWEFLSDRYGNSLVRNVIQRTGTGGGFPDQYSTQALRKVLQDKGGLPRLYAAFAAANTQPRRSYDEGGAFPGVAPVEVATLRSESPRASFSTKINHLAAKTVTFRPDSLTSKKWRLRVRVDVPPAIRAPAVSLLVIRTDGTLQRRGVALAAGGRGRATVAFSTRKVRAVSATLANASTRYRCSSNTDFACQGRPRDQQQRFTVKVKAFRR